MITLLLLFCAVAIAWSQPLPEVGTILWEMRYTGGMLTNTIDYAPNADLIFAGTKSGRILVVKGATGAILDTIYMDSLIPRIGDGLPFIAHCISSSRDGTQLCIAGTSEPLGLSNGKVFLIEYPSRRIVMDNLYQGLHSWESMRVKVSPSGRYVVVPSSSYIPGRNLIPLGHRLYDRFRNVSVSLSCRSPDDRGDFDADERLFVYAGEGKVQGVKVNNQVMLLDLDDLSKPAKLFDEYGVPKLSSDGRFIMNCGLGYHVTTPEYSYYPPSAMVIDIESDSVVWRLDGRLVRDEWWMYILDLRYSAWSHDAKRMYTERHTSNGPEQLSGGLFFNVGDSIPYARICDACSFSGDRNSQFYTVVSNPQLTISYSITPQKDGITARLLSPTTAIHSLTTEHGDDGVYPNPTIGDVSVRGDHAVASTWWSVSDVTGKTVAYGLVPQPGEGGECLVRLPQELKPGVYVVLLLDAQNQPLCSHSVIKR